MGLRFFLESALLGIGLAMDAFSVSLANGLNEPCMKKGKVLGTAGIFAFFQALMPMIGWVCVHTLVNRFSFIQKIAPIAALILLLIIGGKMLYEGIKGDGCDCENKKGTGAVALLVQGIATSIDALSVGFTISEYGLKEAIVCASIIAVITFAICVGGIIIGKKAGTRLAGKAGILGGAILIAIGIEIFVSSLF